ncbi:glycosyltransferase family 4 protein [Carnobacteriaceae bacterium zg-ZUI240]|nr:glycosyltransferase family 4 protein [Carnobacteriaceae bacterium zg-ZUI240]
MKIALFTDTYFPQVSGVATSIKILKEELESQGHSVVIFTTTDPDAPEHEEGIVRIASIPFLFFTDRRMAIGGMYKAMHIAKEEKFDLVHTHTEFGMGLIGKYVAYRLKIPSVHTYHTMYEKYLHYIANGHLVKPTHVKWLSHYFCNHTSGVIAPGDQMAEILKSYHIDTPIQTIPTGVPIPEYNRQLRSQMRKQLDVSDDEIILLSLSRVAKEKSIDLLIDAMPEVLKKHGYSRLVIVGDGPERQALEQQVKRLNLEDCVTFTGEINHNDVFKYYQMADVYINASQTETQGLTYLEALVNQLPVVAKKNDYLSSIITDKSMGQLYNDIADLPKTICEYISYLNNSAPTTQEKRDALLYDISAKHFGEMVYDFYTQAIASYATKQTNTENPKSLLNRIYFKQWFSRKNKDEE